MPTFQETSRYGTDVDQIIRFHHDDSCRNCIRCLVDMVIKKIQLHSLVNDAGKITMVDGEFFVTQMYPERHVSIFRIHVDEDEILVKLLYDTTDVPIIDIQLTRIGTILRRDEAYDI